MRAADGDSVYAPATLRRWTAAIADRHHQEGHPSPITDAAVRQAMAAITGAGASHPSSESRSAAPLLTADITAMLVAARKLSTAWAGEVFERRDSALLLMGYAGALGRADLCGLTCGDLTQHVGRGLDVRIVRTTGVCAVRLPIVESHNTCPPCAVHRWLQVVAAFDSGGRPAVIRTIKADSPFEEHVCGAAHPRTRTRAPLFRSIRKNGNLSPTALSGASIHLAVRRMASQAGYDDVFVERLGVQSLRAGFVTQALRNGADPQSIVRHTGHAGVGALYRYLPADGDAHDAVSGLGL